MQVQMAIYFSNSSKRTKKKKYLLSENLGLIPCTGKQKVAIVIHGISGSNHAIDTKWPPEFRLLDLDGVDLQGVGDRSMWDGFVCG